MAWGMGDDMAQIARVSACIEMLETKFEYIENVLEYHLSNSKKLLDFIFKLICFFLGHYY